MGRFWSLFFLLVPILGTWIIVAAAADTWPFNGKPGDTFPFPGGHWFPENINPDGEIIDLLFIRIFYLTGAIFIGTGIALFWFMWKYDVERTKEPVKFTHGSHTLEVVWSILPAATLLFIAVYQMNAWADHKLNRPMEPGPDGVLGTTDDEPKPPLALVTGRQFEWRVRYAGKDKRLFTHDDVFTVNDLHVPKDEEIVIQIESQDVLHSFFLPNLRVKQDVVPGMTQFVWFRTNQTGVYDIVCAELCGWGHYKMRGQITVDKNQSEFDQWLNETYHAQEQDSYSPPSTEEED